MFEEIPEKFFMMFRFTDGTYQAALYEKDKEDTTFNYKPAKRVCHLPSCSSDRPIVRINGGSMEECVMIASMKYPGIPVYRLRNKHEMENSIDWHITFVFRSGEFPKLYERMGS